MIDDKLFSNEQEQFDYSDKPFEYKAMNNTLSKYILREQQIKALDFSIESLKSNKFLLMDMPVGSGKSLYALNLIKKLYEENPNTHFDMLTNSKVLQKQYIDEFKFINNLWGRDNYTCTEHDVSCKEGAELAKLTKKPCGYCPYMKDRQSWVDRQLSLTNFQLFIIFTLYQKKIIENKKKNVLIIDEAHTFEDTFSNFISIYISKYIFTKLKISESEVILKEVRDITTMDQMYTYITTTLRPIIEKNILDAKKVIDDRKDVHKRDVRMSKHIGKKSRLNNDLTNIDELVIYLEKIDRFISIYPKEKNNWCLEVNRAGSDISLIITPVWSSEYLKKEIWDHYDKVIFMSGTILDKDMFCELYGLDKDKSSYFSSESSFPQENRPVYYIPCGKMSYNNKLSAYKNMYPVINKLVSLKHKNDKGIIHTHTYEFSNWLKDDVISNNIIDNRYIFHNSENKILMLETHITAKDNTVIVSPSMSEGVDLKDNLSRFQIIMKIPYPSLGSQKIKLRQNSNPKWYTWITICGVMQMCGRSIRNKEDYAYTYILDSNFGDMLRYNSEMFGEDFKGCLKMVSYDKVK